MTGVGLVALFIGVGIGGASGQPSGNATTEPAQATVTTTVTPPAKTASAVAPPACLRALGNTEGLAQGAGHAFGLLAKFPPLIAKAALAGTENNVASLQQITGQMRGYNTSLKRYEQTVTRAVAAYKINAASCRTGH